MNKFVIVLLIALFPIVAKCQNIGLNIGDKAPEITSKTPDDQVLKLSQLQGKVVLIDFWASWCVPCRKENRNVVSTYNEYNNKEFVCGDSFEIFSVSLDNNKTAWKKAIDNDNLVWSSHVCDFKGWYGEASTIYQLESIPANFLIDKDGIIIGKDLRGDDLANALKQILKE